VPPPWLHITTLIAGFADQITPEQVGIMTGEARRLLAHTPPVTITLGRTEPKAAEASRSGDARQGGAGIQVVPLRSGERADSRSWGSRVVVSSAGLLASMATSWDLERTPSLR
jgi:hypothetical protein